MRQGSRGFSLTEALAVMALIGIIVAVAVPLVGETIRRASIREAADQFALDLRAARMIAVTRRLPVDFVIDEEPTNRYRYTRADGSQVRIQLPSAVRILSSSTPETITFRPDGSVTAAATTVLEVSLSGSIKERWTITTSTVGVPTVKKQLVAS